MKMAMFFVLFLLLATNAAAKGPVGVGDFVIGMNKEELISIINPVSFVDCNEIEAASDAHRGIEFRLHQCGGKDAGQGKEPLNNNLNIY
jgi:hypothetical protein